MGNIKVIGGFWRLLTAVLVSSSVVGCQYIHPHWQAKVIAGGFAATTQLQRFQLNRTTSDQVGVYADIAYGTAERQRLDVYMPQHVTPKAVIVWVHGGGWVSGHKQDSKGYYIRLAEQGYAVVAINYHLAPEAQYPTQLHDIDQALDYLDQHAQTLNLPMQQVFLAGDSAGANLVSHYAAFVSHPTLAAQANFQPSLASQQLKGLLLHCGIYDLATFATAQESQWRILNWGVAALVDAYVPPVQPPLDRTAQLQQLSPQFRVNGDYPPVLISGGHLDFLTETQGIPLRDYLKSQGVPVVDLLYRKGDPAAEGALFHEFQFNLGLPAAQTVFQSTLDFLEQVTKQDATTSQ